MEKKIRIISFFAILMVMSAAIFAPWITKYSFDEQKIENRLESPSFEHPMGTDSLGRDLYSRILYGARTSMAVGIITAFFSVIVGTFCGACAGYIGGTVDSILMRIVDFFLIFPSLLLAILVMVIWGQGLFGIIAALSMVGWVNQARLVRVQVLKVKEMLHAESARAIGASHLRIIWKHILPMTWGLIIIQTSFQIPANIMTESFLSFIGIGIQPPHSSWGTLANEGWRGMYSYPHLILFPGTVLFLTMIAFQLLGDSIRNYLCDTRSVDF